MRKSKVYTGLVAVAFIAIAIYSFQTLQGSPLASGLKGLTPRQALARANEWRYTQPQVSSRVTSKEIVFTFPGDDQEKVPLRKEELVLAVAPYVKQTHA
ncbi:MAG: hypothetical protein K9K64_10150 [Desulfohalobiaceae bacterium]|nr:hypothetical protein [Desulfohalobiaceae bacterium]